MSKKWRVLEDEEMVRASDTILFPDGKRTKADQHGADGMPAISWMLREPAGGYVLRRKSKPSKWRKAEDELPKSFQRVLVHTENNVYFVAVFANGRWLHNRDFEDFSEHDYVVTHWREIPKFKPESDT